MNVNRIVKISSNQGGRFTSANRLVDFDIEPDSVYDLSKSYVNLRCSIDQPTADGAAHGGPAICMPFIRMENEDGNAENSVLPNVALVRNCDMSCANRGQIANIRRVDALRSNLKQYTQTTDEKGSAQYKLLTSEFMDSQQIGSPFRNIYKEGVISSEVRPNDVQIPLSELFGFGNVEAYDARKYGRTRIHLELNLDKVSVTQYLGNGDVGNQWSRGRTLNAMSPLTATKGADLTTLFYAPHGDARAPLDLKQSPFWVGQKIRVSATAGGGRAGGDLVNVIRRITAINWRRGVIGANQNNLELTLDSAISAGAALTGTETYTGITVDGDEATSNTFNVDHAELVLEQLSTPPSSLPDQLAYTEFSTEEHTCNQVQNFQRQFEVEPECMNLYIMKADGPLSRAGDIVEWRLRSDNMDLTNRPVKLHEPLAMDRVLMTLENSGKVVDNMNERGKETFVTRDSTLVEYQQDADSLVMIANPLPVTPRPKMVQVNIKSTNNPSELNRICLFKENMRSI